MSILSKEDNNTNVSIAEEKAGVVIARMLNDIRLCIPLDAYDFREKRAKRSLWDLFLNGGFESTKRILPPPPQPFFSTTIQSTWLTMIL